ncbi:MAG: hypothetical protein JW827_05615 [Spirochaetes bacterium]|nr:hypothetical protein [Spirochaetota bacterium]
MKQNIVKEYARKNTIRIFIETGTYLGNMINAVKRIFKTIHSIELDNHLALQAKKRFSRFSHITIWQGDSSKILPAILTGISEPCLFWLDAHYSGGVTARAEIDTPIKQELSHIFDHRIKDHVILIDDARYFIGKDSYPELDDLKKWVNQKCPDKEFYVKYDIIHIHKKNKG